MSADVIDLPTTATKFLSVEDILGSEDREILIVKVPEWKGKMRFKAMPADDAMLFQENLNGPQKKRALLKLFQLCAVDADDNRLFTAPQVEALGKKSWPIFLRLQKPLMQLNGFMQPDKSLAAVKKILSEAGVEDDITRRVEELWREGDDEALKND